MSRPHATFFDLNGNSCTVSLRSEGDRVMIMVTNSDGLEQDVATIAEDGIVTIGWVSRSIAIARIDDDTSHIVAMTDDEWAESYDKE